MKIWRWNIKYLRNDRYGLFGCEDNYMWSRQKWWAARVGYCDDGYKRDYPIPPVSDFSLTFV